MSEVKTKRIRDWATLIAALRTGDVIPVDGPSGTAKISKDDLLKETSQNALAENVAPAFDPTRPNDAGGYAYYKDEVVAYNGATYKFKLNHSSGAWNAAEVEPYTFSAIVEKFSVITSNDYALAVVDINGVFLFGIRHDGSVSFQKGVPEPINRKFIQVSKSIESLLSQLGGKVDVEAGKSLISTLFANSVSFVINNDYVFAFLDASDKLIFGVRNDGTIDSEIFRKFVTSVFKSTFKGSATEQYVNEAVEIEKDRASEAEANLQRQISNINPTIVQGGENNPDEFYLTSIDDKVTLKDLVSSVLSYGIVWVNPNKISFTTQKTIYIISSFVDLNGSSVEIPSDCVLMFFGGCLSNGTIVGNNTKIVYSPKIFSDTLTISGTWAVDFICSDMLQNPFGINALRKLNALMSDDCFNEVVIRPGTYYFEPDADGSALLSMASNTKLRIDGRIEVVPNGFPHNYVIYLYTKHHIEVFGSGTIYGDADEHDYITTASSHEWCHAFQSMQGCHHVAIRDLSIENFPGDAACLSGDNLSISNLKIDHCGRQGISLEMCRNVIVSNCKISDIYRTAPKAAVDIEPGVSSSRASNIKLVGLDISECTGILFINCDCVSIENISAKDCTRLFYGSGAKDVSIKNITSSKSGTTPNDFIDVKNSCERVFADCFAITDEQGGSIDAANVRLGLSCFYNSDFMKPTSAAAGSVSYESGKYIQFNGTSWVNMDSTNL